MRIRTLHHACIAVLLLGLAPRFASSQQDLAEKTKADPDVQRGKAALVERRYADAKRYFETAEGRLGPNSAEINAGIAIAELQLGEYAEARRRESMVLRLVSTDHARAEAHNILGTAWLRESQQNGGNRDQLRAAEDSFREAAKADPYFAASYFNLGEALLRDGRAADAESAFKNFVRASAEDATLAEPPAERQSRAPEFTGTDSSGRKLTGSSLRGRVVLLDFWATWCPPCIRALPVMRELARYFPAADFQLISVDEDVSEQEKWRSFTVQHKMDWTQLWDQGSKVYNSFGLAPPGDLSLPRYVLIDRDGYVLRVYNGTDRLGSLASQVIKAVHSRK